jgi:DHA1 family tetracycline resistance protein-like MFS transporter
VGVTGGVAVLFAARVFDGITGGNVSVAQAYAGDFSSESERASVLGFIGGATGLGYVVGPVFGGILSTISMVAPFYAAIGLTVLTLLLTQLVLAETTRPENSGEETDAATPAFSSSRVLLIVAAFFSILGFSALQNIFPLFGSSCPVRRPRRSSDPEPGRRRDADLRWPRDRGEPDLRDPSARTHGAAPSARPRKTYCS